MSTICFRSYAVRRPTENVAGGNFETSRPGLGDTAHTFWNRRCSVPGQTGADGAPRIPACVYISCNNVMNSRAHTDGRESKQNAKTARLVLYVTTSLWRPSKTKREKNNTVYIRERNARRSFGRRNRLRLNCFVYEVFFSFF